MGLCGFFLAAGLRLSSGCMTQKRLTTYCFRHYSVWCSPLTDEEGDFWNPVFSFKLQLLILEQQQHDLRSSPSSSFCCCPSAAETPQWGQMAGWGASTSFFTEKWIVPEEGRAGSWPKVSWTMSMALSESRPRERADPRIIPDNAEKWLCRSRVHWGNVHGYLR